jgi:hypothetical protein
MRISERCVARQCRIVEVVQSLLDVRFVGVKLVERGIVIRIAPAIARFGCLIPVRRRRWVLAADWRAHTDSGLIDRLLNLIDNKRIADIERQISKQTRSEGDRVGCITLDISESASVSFDGVTGPLIRRPVR